MSIASRYNDVARYTRDTVELLFSFKVPASGAPTVIRDSQGAQVASVSALATGVYTVTLSTKMPQVPQQLTFVSVDMAKAATGTDKSEVKYVADSYDPVARTLTLVSRDATAGTVSGGTPATGNWVSVRLVGPSKISAKDAA